MKICKPIKHLSKPVRKLVKAYREFDEEPIRKFIIEEINYYGHYQLARELETNELQNQLKTQN